MTGRTRCIAEAAQRGGFEIWARSEHSEEAGRKAVDLEPASNIDHFSQGGASHIRARVSILGLATE